jgi:ubiquinone biosynthesis protein UbiJ
MAFTTFDTHKFVRRLEQAWMPTEQAQEQAQVQAEALTEAFTGNMESLVNKEFLAARFAEQDASIDSRIAELEAKVDGNHRIFIWTQAIIMAAVILPYLERLMAL